MTFAQKFKKFSKVGERITESEAALIAGRNVDVASLMGDKGELLIGLVKFWPELFHFVERAKEVAEAVKRHGCCVMHNDSGCPGCTATDLLKEFGFIDEKKEG